MYVLRFCFKVFLHLKIFNSGWQGDSRCCNITGISIVCSTFFSGTDQRKDQSSASLAFVRAIHRWPVNSLHKGPVTWKMFPFDDVIMCYSTEMQHFGFTFITLNFSDLATLLCNQELVLLHKFNSQWLWDNHLLLVPHSHGVLMEFPFVFLNNTPNNSV